MSSVNVIGGGGGNFGMVVEVAVGGPLRSGEVCGGRPSSSWYRPARRSFVWCSWVAVEV